MARRDLERWERWKQTPLAARGVADRSAWSESMQAIQRAHRALAVQYPELQLRLEFAEKRGDPPEREAVCRLCLPLSRPAEVGFFPTRGTTGRFPANSFTPASKERVHAWHPRPKSSIRPGALRSNRAPARLEPQQWLQENFKLRQAEAEILQRPLNTARKDTRSRRRAGPCEEAHGGGPGWPAPGRLKSPSCNC